jgi:hypothetical protein
MTTFDVPPFYIGDYVVTHDGYTWHVHMRALWDNFRLEPVFASTNKREALKHARMLERNRLSVLAAAAGDPQAIAENHKIVKRLQRDERDA